MGVSHSMNNAQVESVLEQFEATTDAIRGIEQKADKVSVIVKETQEQQEALHRQADRANQFVANLTESLDRRAEQVLHLRSALESVADVVERLEITVYDLGLSDLPGQVQRELGPLLMPVLVLTLIVTVSNCCFGFLLSTDNELAESILDAGTLNVLNIFAIFHVALIGVAFLYLLSEGVLMCLRHRRSRDSTAMGVPDVLSEEPQEEMLPEEQEQADEPAFDPLADGMVEEAPPLDMPRSISDPVISQGRPAPLSDLSEAICGAELSAVGPRHSAPGPGRSHAPRDDREREGRDSGSSLDEEAARKPCHSERSAAQGSQSQSVGSNRSDGAEGASAKANTSAIMKGQMSLRSQGALSQGSQSSGRARQMTTTESLGGASSASGATGVGRTATGRGAAHGRGAAGSAGHHKGAVSALLRTALQQAQGGTVSATSSLGATGLRARIASPFTTVKDAMGRSDTMESKEQVAAHLPAPDEGEGRDGADSSPASRGFGSTLSV